MKITVFSSNQPRHLSLVRDISHIAEKVFFVSEVNTVFPGKISDFFKKSETMQKYFEHVIKAEKKAFGNINFLPNNVQTLSIKSGDISLLDREHLNEALNSDIYIIFGASFIKGWLTDFLIANQAINIHMGLSPYYRGSSCNFWSLYDYRPSYVGATIHMLDKGLDSGPMLFHCIPKLLQGDTPFDFSMRSVSAAHYGLCQSISSGSLKTIKPVKQNKLSQLRYTRNSDFTDDIAKEYLERKYLFNKNKLHYPDLLNPIFY